MKSIPPKTVNRRALLLTWGVAALVLAAAELGSRAWGPPVHTSEEELVVQIQCRKIEQLPAGALLCLGDSSLGNAVDAAVLSEELGVPAINAALFGNYTTMGDALLFEYALRREAKPRALVLFHTPEVWNRPFFTDGYQRLARETGLAPFEKISHQVFSTSAMAEQSEAWRVESFAERYGIAWSSGRLTDALARAERARKRFAEFDYIPQGDRPDWEAREGAKPRDMGPFHVDAHVERWLDRLCDAAREAGVPVYFAVAPLRDKKCFNDREYMAASLAWLEQKSDGGRRFQLLWHSTLIAPAARLGDKYDHLNYTAKKTAFTPWFAQRLRAALSGSDAGAPHGEFWDPFADEPVVRPPD